MSKQILFTTEARAALLVGINKVANAVKVTMGANGKNVLISHNMNQRASSTKDGVSVSRSINLADPIENAGALLSKDVAEQAVRLSGDGTTCATLLFQEVIIQAFKNIEAGANSVELKKGIEKATIDVVQNLKYQSISIGNDNEKIRQIATVSANNDDEIGGLIAKAFKVIGNDGIIVIEEGTKAETEIRIDDGYNFDRGVTTNFWFTNQERAICELKNPLILIVDGKIERMKDLEKLFKGVVAKQKKEILIIADSVEGEAMDALIYNKLQGVLDVVIVHAPSFGESRKSIMEDICIATGGKYVSDMKGLRLPDVTIDDCGTCERLVVTKDKTTIVGGKGKKSEIASRSNQIKSIIEQSTSDIEKAMLRERLGKLNEGIAVFSVGGATEMEMKEKKDRVDDAIRATKCAIEEGIIPGGGTALIRCIMALNAIETSSADEKTGVEIIKKSIEAPLRQIAQNAGKNGETFVDKVKDQKGSFGYNAKTGLIEDLVESGIIDATKVIRVALQNAVSVAVMVIISECLVVEVG